MHLDERPNMFVDREHKDAVYEWVSRESPDIFAIEPNVCNDYKVTLRDKEERQKLIDFLNTELYLEENERYY